jgi:hypothetical protein
MPWPSRFAAKEKITPLNAWRVATPFENFKDAIVSGFVKVFGFTVRWAVMAALYWWLLKSVADTGSRPIVQLTLGDLFGVLLELAAVVGLSLWAFRGGEKLYGAWATLGSIVVAVGFYIALH